MMKQFKLFAMAVFAISLAACGNGGKINPTSKKINGPLGKFFEVVERDYKINDDELSVEFKRISEGGPNDASWSTNPTFLVELQDEDGNAISTEHTDVVLTKEQLESVFSLGVDETASIKFIFDKTKGAVKFKVSSKWDAEKEGKNEDISSLSSSEVVHQAAIINDPDGYTNVRARPDGKAEILTKIVDGEKFFFDEVPGSNWVKVYKTADAEAQCIGYMHNSRVNPIGSSGGAAMTDFDEDDDTNFTAEDEGDSSYDEFLDEYEKFWRTYMSFVKKMDKSNPTAMIDYAKLLRQYQSYSEKLEKIKGNLSMSQLNRINKMNVELMEEMSKIQQ